MAQEVSANPAEVVFPLDEFGFTSTLRAAGLDAVSRLAGNDEKLTVFRATLRILAAHAVAKFDVQKAEIASTLAAIAAQEAAEAARILADEAAAVQKLRDTVAETQARIDAFDAAAVPA